MAPNQLVATDGDAVFDATFDVAMAPRRGRRGGAAEFRGDRTSSPRRGPAGCRAGRRDDYGGDRGERREIVVEAGANLRDALVKDGIDVYRGDGLDELRGPPTCGTHRRCVKAADEPQEQRRGGTLNRGQAKLRRSCVTPSTATSRSACGRTGTGPGRHPGGACPPCACC